MNSRGRNTFLLCLLCALVNLTSCSHKQKIEPDVRIKMLFNVNWQFMLNNDPSVDPLSLDEGRWTQVKIPHDWSIEGPIAKDNPSGHFGGYYPGGTGYYRKSFAYNPVWDGKLVQVTFDGIFMNAEVWINGQYLGKHPNGYIGFTYDITPHLVEGTNTLLVRADNSAQPNSRWYTGSGIYRNVWLQVKNKLSVVQDGTFIVAHDITDKSAEVQMQIDIGNISGTERSINVTNTIHSPSGKKVEELIKAFNIKPNDTLRVNESAVLTNPSLWSPDSPALYTLVTKITEGDELLDTYETPFGVRSIRFDSETGFWLNGKNIKIKGVNNHHDGGPVGSAVPDDVLHRRLVILKAMGCNAIRTSHNPFSPEFYNMCDSMGFLVMDEVFDEWIASWPWTKEQNEGKVKYGYHLLFNEWATKDLKAVIKRDRNHPSIFLWSVGNEIPDQCYAESPERLKPLMAIVHAMDSTRPVTAGCCFIHLANATGFASMLDVTGYNGGGGSVFYEKDKVVYPDRKFIATEVPHSFQTRGVYKTKTIMRAPKEGIAVPDLTKEELFPEFSDFYSSSYDNASVRISARDSWRRTDSLSFMSGEFRWTGYDYLGEAIKGWPSRFWNFGIIDLCGFPKDTYYFYQSQWTKEPMVHMLPHWTWPGKEGKIIPVWTYSNCDDVELFLNGKSLGLKSNRGQMNLSWDVPYEPGELRAVGRTGTAITAEQIYKTSSEPYSIQIKVDRDRMPANGTGCVHVEVNVLDKDDNFVPYASNLITFNLTGPAVNIGVDNGDPLDLAPTKANERKAFNGKCLLIIQSTGDEGEATIQASSKGLLSDKVTIISETVKH